MTTITYSFKTQSPYTNQLTSVGFDAGKQSFKTVVEAQEYRKNYPEFFVHKLSCMENQPIVLVRQTIVQEIVE